MRRALFGQATSSAVESCDHEQQQVSAQCARTTDFRTQPVKSSSRNTAGSMKRLKAAFFNSIENSKVDSQIGQDGEISFPHRRGRVFSFFDFRSSFLVFPTSLKLRAKKKTKESKRKKKGKRRIPEKTKKGMNE